MHILEAAAITNLKRPKPYDYACLEGRSFGAGSVMRLSAAILVIVVSVLAMSVAAPASDAFHYAQGRGVHHRG